jgi:hypothetical protein
VRWSRVQILWPRAKVIGVERVVKASRRERTCEDRSTKHRAGLSAYQSYYLRSFVPVCAQTLWPFDVWGESAGTGRQKAQMCGPTVG